MASKSGINIKPSHRGKLTEKAKRAGMGVQEFAKHVKAHPEKYSGTTVKEATFARTAKTKFKHQTGGQHDLKYAQPNQDIPILTDPNARPDIGYASANSDIPMLQNPGNMAVDNVGGLSRYNKYVPRNRPDDMYLKPANELISGITAIGNSMQNSKLKRQERMQLLQSQQQQYMPNMEGEGLDNGLPYRMYGGDDLHGGGNSPTITETHVGPNFKQYPKGIPSDTATNRREEDVPVAIQSGIMPKRYMVGGNANRQAPYLEYGGWDQVGFMMKYGGHDQVGFMMQAGGTPEAMMDPGYCMYGGVGEGTPQDWSKMTNEDYGFEGIAHKGPYGQASIYKNGGDVSSDKAKEILRDGTVHGHPLTAAQKRYFGWKAGGSKTQTGGDVAMNQGTHPMTPGGGGTNNGIQIDSAAKAQWNDFLDFVKQKGMQGSKDLDVRDKNQGQQLMNDYRKANPNTMLNYDYVQPVQQALADQRLKNIEQIKAGKAFAKGYGPQTTDWSGFEPDQSKPDAWFGSKTSSFYFPHEIGTKNGKQTTNRLYQTGGNVEYSLGKITTSNPNAIQINQHYKPHINGEGAVYSQDGQRLIGYLTPGQFNPNVRGANLTPEDKAFLNSLSVNPQSNPTIKNWNDATYAKGNLKVGQLLMNQSQGISAPVQQPQGVAASAATTATKQAIGTYKYGGRKYMTGGLKQDGGVGFAVGDELEMSAEMIQNLRKQGYKVEEI